MVSALFQTCSAEFGQRIIFLWEVLSQKSRNIIAFTEHTALKMNVMAYGFRLFFFMFVNICALTPCFAANLDKPDILLAQIYQRGTDVSKYLVSEKFDGVRAIWDGKSLRSRAGNVIAAPTWFTGKFPSTMMDGELWLEYGKFDELSGIVRKDNPIDAEWQNVSYLVFELPGASGSFAVRAETIANIVQKANLPHLKAVTQMRVKDEPALYALLEQVVANGGEGLVLHRADALYATGRSDALLKLKPLLDAEATVVGHTPGRAKYTGKLGALLVETSEGISFKIGTGFSDALRETPPPIGSVITYTYRGKTNNGKPKFASFLRIRDER